MAGLSEVTVVVEARERSGALITADFALEDGREVFAVPGEITAAHSAGANALIRSGAAPLLSVSDVLAALGLEEPPRPAPTEGPAALVLGALRDAPGGVDEIGARTGLGADRVSAALVELELEGLAAETEGVYRTRA